MAMLGDALRFVSAQLDASVVSPVATRLANSVANPYVLSYFVWERVKQLTPQRARDVTRLLSTAVANAVGVLGADAARGLAGSTRRLQDHVVAATVTTQGRDVVLNSVATASKVAQALNTPETRVATQQLFETLQSLVDFFASPDGRKVIASAGECVTRVCEVAASPEASVFLAEVATNVCHALEVEALRREGEAEATKKTDASDTPPSIPDNATITEQRTEDNKPDESAGSPASPTSSAAETSFETESTMSDVSLSPGQHSGAGARRASSAPSVERERVAEATTPGLRERRGSRSARIERDVLLKMGVDPSMLSEIQRVLDKIREEEERAALAATTPIVEENEEEADDCIDDQESDISSAFGLRSSSLPLDPEPQPVEPRTEAEAERDDVILPEWHPDSVRSALRRRHVAADERIAQRHTFEDQSRDMAEVLTRRRIAHGHMQPADYMACRAITQMIIACFGFVLLVVGLYLTRSVVRLI